MSNSAKHAKAVKSDPRNRKIVLHLIAISISVIIGAVAVKINIPALFAATLPAAGNVCQEIFDFINRL